MSDIEAFLFDGLDLADTTPLIGRLSYEGEALTVWVVSAQSGTEIVVLKFTGVTIASLWFDEQGAIEWPLDIIGFDSFADGEQWRFVLHCDSIELGWRSAWPTKSEAVIMICGESNRARARARCQ